MAIKMVKHIKLSLALLMTMTIAGSCTAATNPTTVTTSYQGSSESFPNPERGFTAGEWSGNQESPLSLSSLQQARSNGMSLIHRIFEMQEFRSSPLSQSFLDFVKKDFETARKAGVKLVLRFYYDVEQGRDASKERILSHLDQLKPILQANKDVIASMDAGFIGAWGEWHTSSNGLDNLQDKKEILLKILSVLPSDRMVAVRYPQDKMDIFNNTNSLTPQEAFNGTYRARTGAYNDCFVANRFDGGTYDWDNPEIKKTFLSLDNRYVVQGGETCQPSEFDDCPNVLKELERMHWSHIASEWQQTVLQGWRDQGCMEEIKRRLGYRFRLLNSTIPDRVKPASTFSMKFQIANDGWAGPFNPRNLEVILRNRQTGQKYYLPVPEATRMWMPGETKTVNVVGGIPAIMPPGEYQVLLNLPDPTTTLRNRPEYSIRLANQNVWEASTGYNSMLRSVTVDPNAGGNNYSGNQFFKSR